MVAKLTILGGSSPFTAALVDALRAAHPAVPPQSLALHGRDATALDLVGGYAQAQLGTLGWVVQKTTRSADALDGAAWVVHQIRYGGLEGRTEDERLAQAHDVPADETLGPAGLVSAIRAVPALYELSALIERYCPDAWVLNLTNPLSITTAMLNRNGVRRCVGLCELPWYTVREACWFLGVPPRQVQWSYSGLNHRGFVHELRHQGRDCLNELPEALGETTLSGISAAEIQELGALPLKYFQLLRQPAPVELGRAEYLMRLRAELLAQLRASVTRSPPSLAKRYLEWYPGAVVPMLSALAANDGRTGVLNVLRDGDIAWETRARIYADRYEPLPGPAPSSCVSGWLDRFAAHERAVLAAALDPTRARIEAALAADPVVPQSKVHALTDACWERCCKPA